MPRSAMLDLALAVRQSLIANIPALCTEINNLYPTDGYPVVPPVEYLLGVRTDMIKRDLTELPVMASGVYMREEEHEGEQEFSSVFMPYVVEVFLGDTDTTGLYVKATKYAMVIDLWVERYASNLVFGFVSDEAPDIDISYVLELRGGESRQLVAATGVFVGME